MTGLPLFAIITVLTTGGDYTLDKLQDAMLAANCGDEIQVEAGATITLTTPPLTWNKDCAPGNEAKMTTTKKAWLPDNNTRITPSYGPLLPTIYIPGSVSAPAVPFISMKRYTTLPARGMILDGIAFKSDPYLPGTHSYTNWGLVMGLENVCDTVTYQSSNITANHLLFLSSSATDLGDVGGMARMEGNNMTLMNSWLDDDRTFGYGIADSNGVVSRNGGDGYIVRNNHFGSGISEGIIMGVGAPFCQIGKVNTKGFTIEHNHFYNSLKWYPDSATYLGSPTIKNHIECKSCENMIARWNTGENQWAYGGAQYYAVTLTPRMSRDQSGCYSADSYQASPPPHPLRVSLSNGGSVGTIVYNKGGVITACTDPAVQPGHPDNCTYNWEPGWAVGGGMSVQTVASNPGVYTGWELLSISKVIDQFHLEFLTPATTTADVGFGAGQYLNWDISNYFNKVENVYIYGNYWKNAAMDGNMAMMDTGCNSNPAIYHTTGGNIQYEHNISVADSPDFGNCCAQGTTSVNHFYLGNNSGYAGDNFRFLHNTKYQTVDAGKKIYPPLTETPQPPPDQRGWYTDPQGRLVGGCATWCQTGDRTGLFGAFDYSNNLVMPTHYGGLTPDQWKNNTVDAPSSRLFNNPAIGTYSYPEFYNICPVGQRQCGQNPAFFGYPFSNVPGDPGNYQPKFQSEKGRIFKVGVDTPFHHTATDATDIGADVRNVAAIHGITVTTTDVAAWVRFTLPGVMCSLPTQIEVSAETVGGAHLVDDLGTYTTVNAINPTMFKRSDSDQYNIRATGANTCERMFMIGDNASATDDNGVSRDLRLTPTTKYYYRVNVGGAQERGQFTTTAPVTPPASWSIPYGTTTPYMKVQSGPNVASLVTGTTTPCGPAGCTFTLTPDANSRQMVYYVLGCDNAGVVSNKWGPYFQMVK